MAESRGLAVGADVLPLAGPAAAAATADLRAVELERDGVVVGLLADPILVARQEVSDLDCGLEALQKERVRI